MSSSLCDFLEVVVDSMCPRCGLVVAGPVIEAAVQDADPAVGEGSQGFVMGVASGASLGACVSLIAFARP